MGLSPQLKLQQGAQRDRGLQSRDSAVCLYVIAYLKAWPCTIMAAARSYHTSLIKANNQYFIHQAPIRICTRFVAGASHSPLFHRYRIINQLVDFRYEPARVAEVKRRFLRLDKCIPLEGFLTGWFLGSPVEAIRRGNVEDFVAYGFYSRYMHELPPNVSPAWMPLHLFNATCISRCWRGLHTRLTCV